MVLRLEPDGEIRCQGRTHPDDTVRQTVVVEVEKVGDAGAF